MYWFMIKTYLIIKDRQRRKHQYYQNHGEETGNKAKFIKHTEKLVKNGRKDRNKSK